MPKREYYYAQPSTEAEFWIREAVGFVPGPFYGQRVTIKQRGRPWTCLVCDAPIAKGDPYIIMYRVSKQNLNIALCHEHFKGSDSFLGDGMPWPGFEAWKQGDPGAGLPKPVLKRGEGTRRVAEVPAETFRASAYVDRIKEQRWRCVYPCQDEHTGGPLLPGEPIALAYDNYGIVHLNCAKIGAVPKEGNPWAKEFANGSEEA